MADWPLPLIGPPTTVVGSFGKFSHLLPIVSTQAATAWPVANTAIFTPFWVFQPFTAVQMAWTNGATVSGNFDVGIYDVAGRRLVSSGSTAQSGTNALQAFDITDTLLAPGLFYCAMAFDNATGIIGLQTGSVVNKLRVLGAVEMASAFPLPTTATFATLTSAYWPLVAIMGNTTI